MISLLIVIIFDSGFEIFRKKKQMFILNLFNSTTDHIEYINTPYSKLSNGNKFSIYECKNKCLTSKKCVQSVFNSSQHKSHVCKGKHIVITSRFQRRDRNVTGDGGVLR